MSAVVKNPLRIYIRVFYEGPDLAFVLSNFEFLKKNPNLCIGHNAPAIGPWGRTTEIKWAQLSCGILEDIPIRCNCLTLCNTNAYNKTICLKNSDARIIVTSGLPSELEKTKVYLNTLIQDPQRPHIPTIVQVSQGWLEEDINLFRNTFRQHQILTITAHNNNDTGAEHAFIYSLRLIHQNLQRQGLKDVTSNHHPYESPIDLSNHLNHISDSQCPSSIFLKNTPEQSPTGDQIQPPFPCDQAPMGWPIHWQKTLSTIPTRSAILRPDLASAHGLNDGSGRSDFFLFRVDQWAFKTSQRRCFSSFPSAQQCFDQLITLKKTLADLCPPHTLIVLQPDTSKQWWLWTISPWVSTLRACMNNAPNQHVLASELCRYAKTLIECINFSAASGIVLDAHPSNFGYFNEKIVYIDDDSADNHEDFMIGFNILRRVDEYINFPEACWVYIEYISAALKTLKNTKYFDHILNSISTTHVYTEIGIQSRTYLQRAMSR